MASVVSHLVGHSVSIMHGDDPSGYKHTARLRWRRKLGDRGVLEVVNRDGTVDMVFRLSEILCVKGEIIILSPETTRSWDNRRKGPSAWSAFGPPSYP
jgi:hypothetical protein